MLDQFGDQPALAHIGIKQEQRPHDGQRGAERAARRLEQGEQADRADDDLRLGGQARACGDRKFAAEDKDIKRAARRDQRQRPIHPRHPVPRRA